jgi:hypothetical protein
VNVSWCVPKDNISSRAVRDQLLLPSASLIHLVGPKIFTDTNEKGPYPPLFSLPDLALDFLNA